MKFASKLRLAATALTAAFAAAALAAPASAANIKVGVLSCDVGGGWGFVIGSSRT
jgi:hypothetical protein